MKRCIECLKSEIIFLAERFGWERVAGFTISGLMAIILAIMLFESGIVYHPVTESDYKELEKQMTAIQQNHELLLQTDCSITIKDDTISIEIQNDECKLIAQYDKNFENMKIIKENKSLSFWWAVTVTSIACCAEVYLFGYLISGILLVFYEEIVKRFKARKK